MLSVADQIAAIEAGGAQMKNVHIVITRIPFSQRSIRIGPSDILDDMTMIVTEDALEVFLDSFRANAQLVAESHAYPVNYQFNSRHQTHDINTDITIRNA